ncbi:MAG: pseudouridine synthase [Bdellovibrionia bacterium]
MKAFGPGKVKLERALSKLGIASRVVAREWILAGKVQVNGAVQRNPDFAVNPERTIIAVDGQRVQKAQTRTFLLYKPKGTVTTHSDEKGRKTVFTLLQELDIHLIAVGRLDWATSGLLLLTNDTRLADWLTDPSNGIQRTYLVTVRGEATEVKLELLRGGIKNQGESLRAQDIFLRKASGRESHLTVNLTEGKNREIRRMFASIGHEVTRLKRVSYGKLELGELRPGEYRELSKEELLQAFPGIPVVAQRARSI